MKTGSTDSSRRQHLAEAWERAYGIDGKAIFPERAASAALSRADADIRAAWRRWHDPATEDGWKPCELPWYEMLERARVEQLASNHLPGMARNLSGLKENDPDSTQGQVYRAAREVFGGSIRPGSPICIERSRRLLSRWFSSQLAPSKETDLIDCLLRAAKLLDRPQEFADCVAPVVAKLACRQSPATGADPSLIAMPSSNPMMLDKEIEGDENHDDWVFDEHRGIERQTVEMMRAYPDYRIYNTVFDEERSASHWLISEDKARLRQLLSPDRRRIRQLAHRLQRRLQAARLRHWEFDQEEGLLDSRRLARLVSGHGNRRVFRRECEAPVPEACVSFLVDMSGSMRGERQRLAAMTVDLAVHTLEVCGIDCEVLGFTTRFGPENPLERHWRRMGSPEMPGRLNALRHISFKTTRQRWQGVRLGLGLMLRENFGRENIDGEALHWAARRISMQRVHRRMLIVLSDGVPHEGASVKANSRLLLPQHLHQVIEKIEDSGIELCAIGPSMKIGQYYKKSFLARAPDEVPHALFSVTESLLLEKSI